MKVLVIPFSAFPVWNTPYLLEESGIRSIYYNLYWITYILIRIIYKKDASIV